MNEKLRLYNALETVVREMLEDRLSSFDLICTCDRCQLDVMAITLNSLPAKYVVKDIGIPFIKAQFLNDQDRANVLKALTEATEIVNKNQHHE